MARDQRGERAQQPSLPFQRRGSGDQRALEGDEAAGKLGIDDDRSGEIGRGRSSPHQFGGRMLHQGDRGIERTIGESHRRGWFPGVRLVRMDGEDPTGGRRVLTPSAGEGLTTGFDDADRIVIMRVPGEGMRDECRMDERDIMQLRAYVIA